jgi:hypothetical protein
VVACTPVANEVQAVEGLQSDGDDYCDDLGEVFSSETCSGVVVLRHTYRWGYPFAPSVRALFDHTVA